MTFTIDDSPTVPLGAPEPISINADCQMTESRVAGIDRKHVVADWLRATLYVRAALKSKVVDVRTGQVMSPTATSAERTKHGLLCGIEGVIEVELADDVPVRSWRYVQLMPTRNKAWEHIQAMMHKKLLEWRDARVAFNERQIHAWRLSREAGVVPVHNDIVGEPRVIK